jgi:hypothetical protein
VARGVGAIGAAAGVAAGAFGRFTQTMARTVDQIDKAAQTADVTTDQIQELRFGFAQLAGTTDRDVDLALQRFNRRSQDTPAAVESALIALADIENGADRAALASKLFGEEAGPKMAGALAGGIASLADLRQQLNSEGGLFSQESIRQGVAFNDEMDRLSRVVTSEMGAAALQNAEAFTTMAEGLAAVAVAGIDAVGALNSFGSQLGVTLAQIEQELAKGDLQRLSELLTFLVNPVGAAGAMFGRGVGERIAEPAGAERPGENRSVLPYGDPSSVFGAPGTPFPGDAPVAAPVGGGEPDSQIGGFGGAGDPFAEGLEFLQGTALSDSALDEIRERMAEREEMERRHQDELNKLKGAAHKEAARRDEEAAKREQATQQRNFSALLQNAATQHKLFFELDKARAIASAVVDMREAITGAYKVGARIGGPPLGAAFAATAGAAQAANIAAIASSSFSSSGGNVAPSVGPTPAPAVTPVGGGGAAGGNGVGGVSQTLTVQGISDDALFSGPRVRALAEQLLEYQRNGGAIVIQEA